MTATIANLTDATAIPAEQREALLDCYWRDLGHAYDWLTQAPDKANELARLRYVQESAARLEAAIVALGAETA